MGCTELKERKPDSKESEGFVRLLLMSQGCISYKKEMYIKSLKCHHHDFPSRNNSVLSVMNNKFVSATLS